MLTVLEAVSAEHAEPPRPWRDHGWRRAPLAMLFVFFAGISARWGNEPSGPTYVERDRLAAFRASHAARTPEQEAVRAKLLAMQRERRQ
jgi:hypothetical protein